jgi:hypothetical protein
MRADIRGLRTLTQKIIGLRVSLGLVIRQSNASGCFVRSAVKKKTVSTDDITPNRSLTCSYAAKTRLILEYACAVKAGAFQWEIDPPGNWFVPPGNNRSGGGGNKAVGAFDVKGRLSGSVSM